MLNVSKNDFKTLRTAQTTTVKFQENGAVTDVGSYRWAEVRRLFARFALLRRVAFTGNNKKKTENAKHLCLFCGLFINELKRHGKGAYLSKLPKNAINSSLSGLSKIEALYAFITGAPPLLL